MSDLCHFRSERECICPSGQCLAQPKPLPPHHSFPLLYQLSACVVIGSIFGFIAYVALPMADEHYKVQALANQENVNAHSR